MRVGCRKGWVALFLILMPLLCGCAGQQPKPTGEYAYIFDLRLIDNTVYWLGKTAGTYELFRGNATDKESIMRFPGITGIAFCDASDCYLYSAEGVLSAYYPASDRLELVCSLQAVSILCATENYVLASSETENIRIKIKNGSTRALENMPPADARILDIYGNSVIYWDESKSAICRFDCDRDSVSVLYSREPSTSSVMVTGILFDGSLYYAESQGGLNEISNKSESAVNSHILSKSVVATARTDTGMVLAAKEASDIVFYILTDEEALTELAVWHDAKYVVNGSCLLCASSNKIACAVTSQEEIFEFEFLAG